jgi:hypothetical protein
MKYYLFIYALICGCSSVRNISGEYLSKRGLCDLMLNQDSTFTYRYKFQIAYKYAIGRWSTVGKNKIKLNSDIRSRVIPLKVQENTIAEHAGQDNTLMVNVNIPKEYRTYYQCSIFIDDVKYDQRNCDSLSLLRIEQPLGSLYFQLNADERIPARFLDTLRTEVFVPKKKYGNQLKIDFDYNDSLFNYQLFNDELMKVSKNKLNYISSKNIECQYLFKMK